MMIENDEATLMIKGDETAVGWTLLLKPQWSTEIA
jgi:hypothetical protein